MTEMYIPKNTTTALLGKILPVLMIFSLSATGRTFGQQEKVVFTDRNIAVKDAFELIQQQTKFLISLNNSDFDVAKKVKLTQQTLPVSKAMTQLTAGSNKSYTIQGRYIVIVPAASATLPLSAQKGEIPADISAKNRRPDSALAEPPVDVDSLERALRVSKADFPAEIPPEPRFNQTPYYMERKRAGFVTGTPSYKASLPTAALRTNLLYGLGALAPNIGLELRLSPKSTILATGSYNGWNSNGLKNNNKKLNHWTVSAEYRRWFCEVFNGHFIGVHGFYGFYNVSGMNIPLLLEKDSGDYRYRGNAYGAGVSYGYHLPLAKRWSVEFNVGVGVGVMNYDKYNCPRCGDKIEENTRRIFVAPTKLGISLVYVIK